MDSLRIIYSSIADAKEGKIPQISSKCKYYRICIFRLDRFNNQVYDQIKMARKQQAVKKEGILSATADFFRRYWTPLLAISLTAAVIWKLYRIYGVPAIARLLGINLAIPYLPENIPLIPLTMLLLVTLIFAFFLFGMEQAVLINLLIKPNRKIRAIYNDCLKLVQPVTTVLLLNLLLLTAGTLILIIPLFIIAFFLQFSVYCVILDGKKGFSALAKSADTVKSNLGFTFLHSSFLWLSIIIIHLFTRKLLYTSIAYHTFIIPFIVTYNYFLYKSLKIK